MERNANFILVGLITFVGLISLAVFAFWLGKYGVDQEKFQPYRTYVYESVSGLKPSSPVRLKGIEVGFVEEVRIDGENPERILIDFKVFKETPVKVDCTVVLNAQGIAGIAYLEIQDGTLKAPFLQQIDRSKRPIMRSKPSVMSRLGDKAETILTHVDQSVLKFDQLLSDKNIRNTATSLENLSLISTELKNNRQEITTMVKGAIAVEANATQAIQDFSHLGQKSEIVLEETRNLAQESALLVREIRQSDPAGKLSATLENSNQAIEEGKSLIREGKILIQSLQESPSDLLFKSKPRKANNDEE